MVIRTIAKGGYNLSQQKYSIEINAKQVILHIHEGVHPVHSVHSAAEGAEQADSFADALVKQTLRDQFEPKKRHNLHLADAYQLAQIQNGADKAVRLATCARWLEFALPPDGDDKRFKITKTSSCHVRLCPVCQWRRSRNTFRNLALIYGDKQLRGQKHLFVTLTQRNVPAAQLRQEIKRLSDAYTAMMRRKPLKDIVKGYTRTIEITRNAKTGEYHPHIHAIWTVSRVYGHGEYISQKDLTQEWEKALKLDYTPVCHVQLIKNMDGKSVAEVAKYSVKPTDYITDSITDTAKIVEDLDAALDGKRFVSYGGIVKNVKQQLFASKPLEDIEAEEIPKSEWENWERVLYEWHFSEGKYKKITV